jgi:hypothetical protein
MAVLGSNAEDESRFQRWRFLGAMNPGALPPGWPTNMLRH